MIKDKIKEIEQKYDMWADDFNLTPQDVECLIKQAKLGIVQQEQFHDYQAQNLRLQERVQELKEVVETNGSAFNTLEKLFIESEQQNKRYRAALEFYADRNNYLPEHIDPETDEKWSKIDYDEGLNARKTLEKIWRNRNE